MFKLLNPGDLAADLAGLGPGTDSRQIFRMFVNTLVFGALGVVAILLVL